MEGSASGSGANNRRRPDIAEAGRGGCCGVPPTALDDDSLWGSGGGFQLDASPSSSDVGAAPRRAARSAMYASRLAVLSYSFEVTLARLARLARLRERRNPPLPPPSVADLGLDLAVAPPAAEACCWSVRACRQEVA